MKVFVAGATGALGRPLVRALVAAGHDVTGTTRSRERLASIESDGATGILCDALDREAVLAAVAAAQPEVVVHQLTALPNRFAKLRKESGPTNRLRREATRHLVDAALRAGARRVIAESIAFLYPPSGPRVADESTPIWSSPNEPYRSLLSALADLEDTVTGTDGIEGVVLRYGTLYGPGTWYAADGDLTTQLRRRMLPVVGDGAGITSFLHVDDAATATLAALDHGSPGVYNIVDDEPVEYRDLFPALAHMLRARRPLRVPAWLVRPFAGAAAIDVLTRQRGATNDKARRELGWSPRFPSWRDGFAVEYAGGAGPDR